MGESSNGTSKKCMNDICPCCIGLFSGFTTHELHYQHYNCDMYYKDKRFNEMFYSILKLIGNNIDKVHEYDVMEMIILGIHNKVINCCYLIAKEVCNPEKIEDYVKYKLIEKLKHETHEIIKTDYNSPFLTNQEYIFNILNNFSYFIERFNNFNFKDNFPDNIEFHGIYTALIVNMFINIFVLEEKKVILVTAVKRKYGTFKNHPHLEECIVVCEIEKNIERLRDNIKKMISDRIIHNRIRIEQYNNVISHVFYIFYRKLKYDILKNHIRQLRGGYIDELSPEFMMSLYNN
jgi:hypothetical protein